MNDLEPVQLVGIGLAVVGLVSLIAIRVAVGMAFRTLKLGLALALVVAGVVVYLNGGDEEIQRRIDERNSLGTAATHAGPAGAFS